MVLELKIEMGRTLGVLIAGVNNKEYATGRYVFCTNFQMQRILHRAEEYARDLFCRNEQVQGFPTSH